MNSVLISKKIKDGFLSLLETTVIALTTITSRTQNLLPLQNHIANDENKKTAGNPVLCLRL
jgi:hypothetical protein